MKRMLYIFSILFLIIAILTGCSVETDEELLAKVDVAIRANTFYNQPEARTAVSELLGRGNPNVKAPMIIDCLITTGALLLTNNAEWIDPDEAYDIYELIKRFDNETIIGSLVRKVTTDEANRLHVLFLGVKLGIPGSQERLNQVLDEHGTKKMAEDFLNSGSPELYQGGERWANNHGYEILTGMGSHRVSWGEF